MVVVVVVIIYVRTSTSISFFVIFLPRAPGWLEFVALLALLREGTEILLGEMRQLLLSGLTTHFASLVTNNA